MVVEAKIEAVEKKLALLPITLRSKDMQLKQACLNSELAEHQEELEAITKKLVEFVSQKSGYSKQSPHKTPKVKSPDNSDDSMTMVN
jgi:hypothetical protein